MKQRIISTNEDLSPTVKLRCYCCNFTYNHNNDYQQWDEVPYSGYSIMMAHYPMGN